MAAPPNWPDMILPNDDALLDQRIPMLLEYRTNAVPLMQENTFLTRSVFIRIRQNYSAPTLEVRLLQYAASMTGRRTVDFNVAQVEEVFGDFLLVCPSINIDDRLLQHNSFNLDNRYDVRLEAWHHAYGLNYAPAHFRAIIKLNGVPLNLWNRVDLTILVSGFCYPVSIEPHFEGGNYNSMRMLVSCHHPTNIPRFLHSHDPPFGAMIEVILLAYARVGGNDDKNHGLPPPPPPPDVPHPPPYMAGQPNLPSDDGSMVGTSSASDQGSRVSGG